MFLKFEKFLELKKEADQKVDDLSKKLQSYSREANGMVKQEIRNSREFKIIKSDFDFHFKRLRQINEYGNQFFKKELRIERGNRFKWLTAH